ncbi:Aspartic proteinase-like protein 2, partial [Tetrabaena socialis]
MVPLRQREVSSRRRHLLRSGALAVQGAVREVGYFYTTLSLGTPARTFSVIIDTGSTITYIPCKGCAHCGKHTDEWFDPDASTTANKLGCSDPLCNCGSPSCSCNNNRCYYSRTYAERSSSEGWLIEDAFGFPDDQPPVRMVFGCENGETGEIYRQMADGIMGMGNNHNAFQSQLVQRGVIEDVFSLCFGYPKDGILLLGDMPMPEGSQTVYTPLLNNLHMHYYNVKMDGITVNGQQLPLDQAMFDRGYGVVLDSGTTFTYLPSDAFNVMAKAVGDYAEAKGLKRTPGADPQYNDICWKGAPDEFQGLEQFFPPAEFVFGEGARLQLPPLRYLFLSKPSEYCLGFFDNGNSGTLIGGVSVRDMVVT